MSEKMKKNEQRTYTQRKEDDLRAEGRLSNEETDGKEREGKARALAQNTKGRRNQMKRWKYLKRNSASTFHLFYCPSYCCCSCCCGLSL